MEKDIFILETQEVFDKIAIKIEYIGDNREKDATLCYMGKNICDGEPILVDVPEATEIVRWVLDKNEEQKKKHNEIWRAELGETYYYIDCFLGTNDCCECSSETDDKSYNSYNYFETREQAEEVIRRIKGLLKEYHEEVKNATCN